MGTIGLLVAILTFTLIGCLAGIVTGLVPGIHVNNVAYMVMASQSLLVGLAVWLFGWASPSGQEILIMVCALVMGNVVTHTFLDFIPSVFLGAPDGDTALSLLPGHRMMLAGRGYEAVKCSVIGSLGALFLGLLLLVPLRLIIGSPVNAYDALAAWMPLLLMAIALFLILTETAGPNDPLPGRRSVILEGYVFLGDASPGDLAHDGQMVSTPPGLNSLDTGAVALVSGTVICMLSEGDAELVVLESKGQRCTLRLNARPALMPEPGERITAAGTVRRLLTWKDHAAKRLMAAGLFLLSGLLGVALLSGPGMASRNIRLIDIPSVDPSTVLLFPLFTGLFGLSTLLMSMMDSPEIPEQELEDREVRLTRKRQFKAIASGTAASTASWFPGISSAISTIISVFLHRSRDHAGHPSSGPGREEAEGDTREFIVSVSAVNTAVGLFNLMALFVILRSRSGAMKAVERILAGNISGWEPLSNVPLAMSSLLLSALIAGIVAAPLTLFFGRFFARRCSGLDYTMLVRAVVVLLVVMVLLLAGVLGLAILAVATCMGMLPPLLGVKRVHLMGCLILPVMLFFL